MLIAGETLFLRQAITRDPHLWIVAFSVDRKIVIFNLTTHKPRCDESCVVEAGDHPYVKHKSIIAYQFGRLCEGAAADALETHGIYKKHAPLSESLLRRIRLGSLASKLTSDELKALIRSVT